MNQIEKLKEIAERASNDALSATEQTEIYVELRALLGNDPILPLLRAYHALIVVGDPNRMEQDASGNWFFPNQKPTRKRRFARLF